MKVQIFSIIGSFFFIANQFSLVAQDYKFPVEVTCNEVNKYECTRIDSIKFDISQISEEIERGFFQDSIHLACIYHQIALEYYNEFDELKSLQYNKKAEKVRSKLPDGLLWRTYLNIGSNYYNLYEYKLAIKYFEKVISLNENLGATDLITVYSSLAVSFMEIGEFNKAINFSKKSIGIKANLAEMNSAKNAYSTILISSRDPHNLVEAVKYSHEIYKSIKSTEENENIQIALNNLGRAHKILNNLDSALIYYNKAVEVAANMDTVYKAILLSNIAVVYKYQKKYNLSIETLQKSLSLFKKYYKTSYQYDYSANFENLADNYTSLQQFDTALNHYQKALINLTNNFRNDTIFKNPNPKETTLFIYSNPDMIRVLHLKATASYQYYKQNNNPQYLNLAHQTYQALIDFHNKLQLDISTENSRLFQAKNIVPYIENALKVAYELQEKGKSIGKSAFRFMEKNKATVLLQSMNEANALQFSNLPDSLLEQEKDLKIAITYHKQQLNEAIEYEETDEIQRLENLLFEENQQYIQLINYLEKNYPNYYRLKYQQNQTQLVDVQNTLDDKTVLLEYFVGDSSIYILSIQKNHSKLYQIKKPDNWQQTINHFQQSLNLKDTVQTSELDRQFVKSAYQLYQWLMEQPAASLNENISSLLIIPDGVLNYIPFGTLLTDFISKKQQVNYKTLPYLLNQKAIGYAYSGALWLEQQQKEHLKQNGITYAGFAPEYGKASGQFNLKFAVQSVRENADLFKGTAFVKERASRQEFEQSAPKFTIIQLAMHVLLNDEKPMQSKLLFSQIEDKTDTELAAANLYNLKLQAALAVLDACNTGSGQLQNGEGVMSLSRAFTYSGCASLVTSLWSIKDESTATIVKHFFKNLKTGDAKHLALQQAKLDYIKEADLENMHPSYWAGLVVSGNQSALY